MRIERFQFDAPQAKRFAQAYSLVQSNVDLPNAAQIRQCLSEFKGVAGIYFWLLEQDGRSYKVYIGKAKSLSARISNYVAKFQPRAPDDFKMRIFQEYMREVRPGHALSLYVKKCSPDAKDLACAEAEEIRSFAPLLIQRAQSTAEDRALIRDAYVAYYRRAFERRLRE